MCAYVLKFNVYIYIQSIFVVMYNLHTCNMYLYNFLLYYFHYGCTRVYVPGSLWNTQISFTTCYLAVFGTQIYTTFSGRAPHVYMTCTCTCSPFMFKSSTALPVNLCTAAAVHQSPCTHRYFFLCMCK